jgi:hypothetical protein
MGFGNHEQLEYNMKCPKCGFMSFDFNEICPKCQRNIISEREKMDHFPFKPEPPFLLGALLARTGHAQADVELSEAAIVAGAQEGMFTLEERTASVPSPMGLEESPLEESPADTYSLPSDEEAPLAIERLEFDQEESGADEEVVEVSTGTDEPGEMIGTESSPLDEDVLSLELEDLFEADKRSQLVERKEAEEEALTLEMNAFEPIESEPSAEPAPPPEMEEPEELFDSFDVGEAEPAAEEPLPEEEVNLESAAGETLSEEEVELEAAVEEQLQEEETLPAGKVTAEPADRTDEPSPGEADELFSLDDLKGYKVGQYDILTQPPPAMDGEPAAGSSAAGPKADKAKGVWEEISKDLQDLDFDLDGS